MIPQTKKEFKHFVGIDLGGGRGKNTAVVLLEEDQGVTYASLRSVSGSPFYDEILTQFLMEQPKDTLVAIDAPLTLPICQRCVLTVCPGASDCEEPVVIWLQQNTVKKKRSNKPTITPYTQRISEVFLHTRHGIHPKEALGQSMGPVTARAQHLRRRWRPRWQLNQNLIEVYPRATLHKLLGSHYAESYRKHARVWEARAQILERLSDWVEFAVWREPVLQNTHIFEAVICALTGLLWSRDNWKIPEELEHLCVKDGWIWVPNL